MKNRYAHLQRYPTSSGSRQQPTLERDAILARIQECKQAVASADAPPSWRDFDAEVLAGD